MGGSPALPGKFPYQVSIKLNGVHNCGGTIISKNYILTAAHCVVNNKRDNENRPISSLTIHAGTTHRDNGGVRIPVAEFIVHPKYIYIRLAKALTFSESIQPIKLSSVHVPAKTPVVISSWGRLSHDGEQPKFLQWTDVHSLSQRGCTAAMRRNADNLLCLGHPANKGACTGDSGGPAVVDNRLVGVASYIRGGCGTLLPDAYVNVSKFFCWIVDHSDV